VTLAERRGDDLRERMRLVATKPVRPMRFAPAARSRPRKAVSRLGTARAASVAVPPVNKGSRLETLFAWGAWELSSVPRARWRWLTSLVLGRPVPRP
jgi:hypothetical protein